MVNIYTYENGRYVIQYVSIKQENLHSSMNALFEQGFHPKNIIISDGYDLMCRNLERLNV